LAGQRRLIAALDFLVDFPAMHRDFGRRFDADFTTSPSTRTTFM
jgi:hypothetical protein